MIGECSAVSLAWLPCIMRNAPGYGGRLLRNSASQARRGRTASAQRACRHLARYPGRAKPAPLRTKQRRCAPRRSFPFHGGPRLCGTGAPGAGSHWGAATVCTQCSVPTLQHGHCSASMRATRLMNSHADSMARGLGAGMCRSRRAASSFLPLQAGGR